MMDINVSGFNMRFSITESVSRLGHGLQEATIDVSILTLKLIKGSENNSVSISTFDVCVDWYTDQQRAILVTTYLVFFGTDHLKNIQK